MKVLIVNRYMGIYGGAETVVKELASHLNNLGVKNLIITLNISEEVKKICSSLEVITPQKVFSYRFRSTDFLSSLGIIREIKTLRYLVKKYASGFDLINVHNFPANWAIAGLNKPVVWMCNEIPDFYYNPRPSLAVKLLRKTGIMLDRSIVNKFIGTICAADEFNAQKVISRYGRTPKIIPYGIDYDFFSEDDENNETAKGYGLNKSFVLLQAGMLSPEKNQLESIRVVEKLRNEISGIKLILAGKGGGAYEKMLKDYIEKKGLRDDIIFTGHLSKREVKNLYHICDIALFPVKTQGGWLAPFEALSAGKPAVVSTTMGAASIFKKENLGVVSDDFTGAIKEIYIKYNFYKTIAQKDKEWVKNNLTWELFTKRMLAIYEETLDDWRGV